MFVAKVFGQLRFQRGLQDALRELAEQASRPSQAHSLFLRLREQPRGKFLLTDNLPGHGTNHRLVQQLGRVNHGHLLTDQAGLSHTVFPTVPDLGRR